MPGFGYDLYGMGPGPTSAAETYYYANQRWGGTGMSGLFGHGLIDGTTRDSTNTPNTDLRAGLILGQIASSGNLRDYGDNNTDGSDQVVGVLLEPMRITDFAGNNVNRFWGILVGGPVQAANLYGLTEQARKQMAARFWFDDRNYIPSGTPATRAKTANYTVVNGTDNGITFTTTGSSVDVTFTLPTTLQKGQKWRFSNIAAHNMTVTAPSGKMVTFNNAAATSVSFQTANNLVGGTIEIIVDETGAKYIAIPHGANTLSVA